MRGRKQGEDEERGGEERTGAEGRRWKADRSKKYQGRVKVSNILFRGGSKISSTD